MDCDSQDVQSIKFQYLGQVHLDLTGPMQPVPDFTVPTLSGTFTFQSDWNGEDVYLFMFKFTNSDGSSNYNTWNTNLVH